MPREEESEIDDGDMEGERREDENHVVLGEGREAGYEEGRKSVALRDEARVAKAVVGGGVNEEGGGGGGDDGEEEVGERNGEGRRRERDGGPEAVEGLGFGAEAIGAFEFFSVMSSFRHHPKMKKARWQWRWPLLLYSLISFPSKPKNTR